MLVCLKNDTVASSFWYQACTLLPKANPNKGPVSAAIPLNLYNFLRRTPFECPTDTIQSNTFLFILYKYRPTN